VPDGASAVRVHLFRMPHAEKLERLTGTQKFILASLVWHQDVSADEAASVLRLPRQLCHDTLALLAEWGVVEAQAERCRITTAWLQPVRRHLRREHLIED
jgi:hypothetical protein